MNRRDVLLQSAAVAGAGLFLPKVLAAEPQPPPPPPEIVVQSQISANHGHALNLSPIQALEHLRATRLGQPVTLDIRGQSNHPHAITLTHAALLELFAAGQIEVESTATTHTHMVLITLEIV